MRRRYSGTRVHTYTHIQLRAEKLLESPSTLSLGLVCYGRLGVLVAIVNGVDTLRALVERLMRITLVWRANCTACDNGDVLSAVIRRAMP